jgi:hypothetical protein
VVEYHGSSAQGIATWTNTHRKPGLQKKASLSATRIAGQTEPGLRFMGRFEHRRSDANKAFVWF